LDKQTYKRWKSTLELNTLADIAGGWFLSSPSLTSGSMAMYFGVWKWDTAHISKAVLNVLEEFCAAFFSEMTLDLMKFPEYTRQPIGDILLTTLSIS
jgi:hypothetical protein